LNGREGFMELRNQLLRAKSTKFSQASSNFVHQKNVGDEDGGVKWSGKTSNLINVHQHTRSGIGLRILLMFLNQWRIFSVCWVVSNYTEGGSKEASIVFWNPFITSMSLRIKIMFNEKRDLWFWLIIHPCQSIHLSKNASIFQSVCITSFVLVSEYNLNGHFGVSGIRRDGKGIPVGGWFWFQSNPFLAYHWTEGAPGEMHQVIKSLQQLQLCEWDQDQWEEKNVNYSQS